LNLPKIIFMCLLGMAALFSPGLRADSIIHHDLRVQLDFQADTIRVRDRISLAAGSPLDDLSFTLHPALRITDADSIAVLAPLDSDAGKIPRYQLRAASSNRDVTLEYVGRLSALASSVGEGLFLSGSHHWYPNFYPARVTFDLRVETDNDWITVTQGTQPANEDNHWMESRPQQTIYLVVAPFTQYRRKIGGIDARAYLLHKDDELAQRYLDVTSRYIALYSGLLGAYPLPQDDFAWINFVNSWVTLKSTEGFYEALEEKWMPN